MHQYYSFPYMPSIMHFSPLILISKMKVQLAAAHQATCIATSYYYIRIGIHDIYILYMLTLVLRCAYYYAIMSVATTSTLKQYLTNPMTCRNSVMR